MTRDDPCQNTNSGPVVGNTKIGMSSSRNPMRESASPQVPADFGLGALCGGSQNGGNFLDLLLERERISL
jgi:hypothetical protein